MIIVLFLAIQGVLGYYATQLPPLSGPEDFLPPDYVFLKASSYQRDNFRVCYVMPLTLEMS